MDTPPAEEKRILIVEDDPDVALSMALLKGPGIETAIAVDGLDALARASIFRPHLVTLDLELPRLDGAAVLAALARLPSRPSVIVVSAQAEARAADTALADLAIGKPYNPEFLRRSALALIGLSPDPAIAVAVVAEREDLVDIAEWAAAEALGSRARLERYGLGTAALRAFVAAPPDVALVGDTLPDMDGRSFLDLVRCEPRLRRMRAALVCSTSGAGGALAARLRAWFGAESDARAAASA